jgi:glycerophosphoryl diester phosphodiesterase
MLTPLPLAPWPYPLLFAHRGGGRHAPENTVAAIVAGAKHGYRAVEFDVKLSRDDRAFLLHDDTLDRTTNGTGAAQSLDYAELATFDAGSWHSAAFVGEPMPRFASAIAALKQHALLSNVEIKPCPGREAATGRQVATECMTAWAGAAIPPLVSSFSHSALLAAREAAPTLPLGWLTKTPTPADFLGAEALACVSMHFWAGAANAALIADIHARGLRALVWTVNDLEKANQLIDWGVDGIFTDELGQFAQALPDRR